MDPILKAIKSLAHARRDSGFTERELVQQGHPRVLVRQGLQLLVDSGGLHTYTLPGRVVRYFLKRTDMAKFRHRHDTSHMFAKRESGRHAPPGPAQYPPGVKVTIAPAPVQRFTSFSFPFIHGHKK